MNRRERPQERVIEVNVSEGWDTRSRLDIFLNVLRAQPFYRPGLLYSGFDGSRIGKTRGSTKDGTIYCAEEEQLGSGDLNDPFRYAHEYAEPAMAVYDPDHMEPALITPDTYNTKNQSALLATFILKGR